MLKQQGFETLIASPPEYENLVAEIYFDGQFVTLVSQERGPGVFDIETRFTDVAETQIARRVDLEGFLNAVYKACDRLLGKAA